MTHSALQIIHGSPFALRHDGAGHCPVDNTFSEAWVAESILAGDGWVPFHLACAAPPGSFVLPALGRAGARYSFWMPMDAEMDGTRSRRHGAPGP